jgi:hypothetical protein
MQEEGIRELILIAQDTTDYGSDLGMKDGLVHLLEELLPRVPAIPWIRIMYAYPGYVTDALIDLMNGSPQIVPYLDMPLQHASPQILRAMKRPANMGVGKRNHRQNARPHPWAGVTYDFNFRLPWRKQRKIISACWTSFVKLNLIIWGSFPFRLNRGQPLPRWVIRFRLSSSNNGLRKLWLFRNQFH